MSKKLWQQLISQNMVTIDELGDTLDKMDKVSDRYHHAEWNELNRHKARLLDDLVKELTEAYKNQPVTSVRLQGYNSFWNEVNQILNGG